MSAAYKPRPAPQHAVEAFLARRRWDFRACLKWEELEIAANAAKLPKVPPFFDRLRRSQRICAIIGAHMRRFAFFNDMGTGKSFLAMALAAYFREAEQANAFVVLVPNRINTDEWVAQVAKHAPELTVEILPSSVNGKMDAIEACRSLLLIETYAGWSRLCSVKRYSKATERNYLAVDPMMVSALRAYIAGFICDESSALGGWDSLQTKIATAFAVDPQFCLFLLSGTPFGRDPQLLWSQMKLLDGGYTLGETLGLFRGAFYSSKTDYWGNPEHEFQVTKTAQLHRFVAHQSIRFKLDDADLPRLVPIVVELPMSSDGGQYYESARAALAASRGSFDLQKNAFARMRQVTSGFLNVSVDGERQRIEFKHNPKLEWLKSQARALAEHKVIIFHDFVYTGERLLRELTDLGIECGLINGQVSKTEISRVYEAFTRGKLPWLLLNSAAGAFGLNLQVASHGIYYESPVPVIQRKQTELRFHRPGSTHGSVVRIDLAVRDSVDMAILDFHKEGKNLFQAVLDGTYTL